MKTTLLTATCAGSAGSATGTASANEPPSELKSLSLHFDGAPGTTSVELLDVLGALTRSIWSRAADNSDVDFAIPSQHPVAADGTEVDVAVPVTVSGALQLNVTDCDPDAVVTLTLILKP